eukprot:2768017-Prymnesium_polylepis.1
MYTTEKVVSATTSACDGRVARVRRPCARPKASAARDGRACGRAGRHWSPPLLLSDRLHCHVRRQRERAEHAQHAQDRDGVHRARREQQRQQHRRRRRQVEHRAWAHRGLEWRRREANAQRVEREEGRADDDLAHPDSRGSALVIQFQVRLQHVQRAREEREEGVDGLAGSLQ